MILCKTDEGAVLVPVRAQPRASRNKVLGQQRSALKIAVTAPPEDGRANDAVAKTLAKALGVRPSAVTLAAGPTSRDKVFRVTGVTVAQVQALAEPA